MPSSHIRQRDFTRQLRTDNGVVFTLQMVFTEQHFVDDDGNVTVDAYNEDLWLEDVYVNVMALIDIFTKPRVDQFIHAATTVDVGDCSDCPERGT